MWFLLLLLSTATSMVRVHGRPQDLSKLPPDDAAVSGTREFLTRGADGASLLETGRRTEPPVTVSDSAAVATTEAYGADSANAGQTPAPGEPGPPTGDGSADDAASSDAASSDAASSDAAGSSEDSPAGGRQEEDGGEEAEVTAQESSTVAPLAFTPPPEPAVATTEAPEPAVATTEAPEPAVATTEAPEPAVATTEAPEPAVATTEAPESAVATTEALEPAVAETGTPKPLEAATEAVPASEEPATEAPVTTPEQQATEEATAAAASPTEAPATTLEQQATEEATAAAVTEAPVTTPEQQATEEATAAAVTEAPVTTPEQQVTEPAAVAATEELQAAESVTQAEVRQPGMTTSAPQQTPTAVSAAEQGKASVEAADGAAQKATAEVSEPPASGDFSLAASAPALSPSAAEAPAAAVRSAALVELDDVYNAGVTSQIGQSSVLTASVHRTMTEVFLKSREVPYRLGQHTVNTYVTDLQVTGIEDMRVLDMASDIDEMSLSVTFQFPEIKFSGSFNATGSILGRRRPGVLTLRTPFPSYGSGFISAVVANTTAVSQVELSHSFNDRKLAIELLTCHLTFGEPEVQLNNVTLPWALRKLHFERLFTVALSKEISHQLATEIKPKVDQSLHDVITGVLDHVSLDEAGAVNFAKLEASPEAWMGLKTHKIPLVTADVLGPRAD